MANSPKSTVKMRRAAIYLFYDGAGQVDRYVTYCLKAIKEHVDTLLVMSNGPVNTAGRAALEQLGAEVVERENIGFDVMAYRDGLEHIGWDKLAEYDEIILLNYTFFGPLHPFKKLFSATDKLDVDFWGITDHGEIAPHPFAMRQVLPRHIQSHWIAVRKSLLSHPGFKYYWDTMPPITSYDASVLHHETRFTEYFASRGFTYHVVWPSSDFASPSAVLEDAVQMVKAGCTIVKRRTFFHDPLYMDRHGILGTHLLQALQDHTDYPLEIIWENLARTCKPRDLVANLNLVEVLADYASPQVIQQVKDLKLAVCAHIFYPNMTEEILETIKELPCKTDLFITTASQDKAREIEKILAAKNTKAKVTLVESNRGRDISAFLLGCADVIKSDNWDLVLKIHSKLSPQDGPNVGGIFKRHLFENLIGTKGHAANVLQLFVTHPNIAMVIPPVPHIGYPTMGHAWFANKPLAQELMKRMGLQVCFDDTTPVAAYGSMFIARPQTLRPLVELGLNWEDFPTEGEYVDGSLAHVVERLFAYVCFAQGRHVREVMNPWHAGVNYGAIEYRAQAYGQFLSARPDEAVRDLKRAKLLISRDKFKAEHPQITAVLRPTFKALRTAKLGGVTTAAHLADKARALKMRIPKKNKF